MPGRGGGRQDGGGSQRITICTVWKEGGEMAVVRKG